MTATATTVETDAQWDVLIDLDFEPPCDFEKCDAAAVWTDGNPDGREVLLRLKRLPGFGDQKARIFLALLGKQYGLTAAGWREAAGDYGKAGTHMSVADVRDAESLGKVRSYKKQMKAAAKAAKA